MKKFLQKNREILAVGVAVFLLGIAGGYGARKLVQADKTKYTPCVFKPTSTPVIAPTDPKLKEFGLKIEKLGVLVPIIKDVDGNDKTAYNKALQNGVAHFKGTALPGDKGNIFIFGHSSAEVRGDYAKIFATLNDLEKGDEIVITYQNTEHKYKVAEKKVVEATDLTVLKKTKTETLTLMTCWPIGTKDKRLIIRADPV